MYLNVHHEPSASHSNLVSIRSGLMFDHHRPTSRRTPLRQSVTGTRQHNRLVAAVAATTETEAEAVEEQPVEQPSVEAPEAQQTERKSFRKERNDRSNKTPITDLAVGQQLEGTVVCFSSGVVVTNIIAARRCVVAMMCICVIVLIVYMRYASP